MAWIETRTSPAGRVTHGVKWRQAGRKHSETFETKAEALRFQADVIGAGEQWPANWIRGVGYTATPEAERIENSPAETPAAPLLLDEAIAYTESKRHTKAAPEHRMKMRRDFVRLLGPAVPGRRGHSGIGEALGATPIDQVDRAAVQVWLDDLAELYSFKTVKGYRAALGAVLRVWALDHGTPNPVDGTFNDGAESTFEPVFLAAWEVDLIVEQLPTEQDRVYVELLVGTGMRKGEALALRVGDLDLTGQFPAVQISKARKHGHDGTHRIGTTKTRSSRRTVTIDPELVELLSRFVAGRHPSETLFDLGNEGTWQRNHWTPALDRAKLADAPRIHDLRHTHASLLLAGGEQLFTVSKRLGHRTIQITADTYGHLDRSSDIAAAATISRVRRPGSSRSLRAV